ncbi:DUF6176 family protein [Cohnella sp. REN36]|uniref:DUF6176 family protein n=1 Tax=Cohnella sp. REN36 TaxID=2887347 RepID=UPI001D13C891|nr:DUF6176 family protein [Cohnella sp. REN36]MCC3376731.1 DUF6176 family protein [Cohnella sp. REN36]
MEVQCLRVKIKPGMTDEFIAFVKELQANQIHRVYETMGRENVVVETIFLERGEEADHILFYTRGAPRGEEDGEGPDSQMFVDPASADVIRKTWDSVQALEVLFDLERMPLDA